MQIQCCFSPHPHPPSTINLLKGNIYLLSLCFLWFSFSLGDYLFTCGGTIRQCSLWLFWCLVMCTSLYLLPQPWELALVLGLSAQHYWHCFRLGKFLLWGTVLCSTRCLAVAWSWPSRYPVVLCPPPRPPPPLQLAAIKNVSRHFPVFLEGQSCSGWEALAWPYDYYQVWAEVIVSL